MSLLLKALNKEIVERPPVWFMRQAGRFLPAYQEMRKKYSLSTLFHTPSLAKEVTLLPLSLLNMDAAILFSDILVITELFGYQIEFPEKGGIALKPPIKPEKKGAEETLSYVKETILLLKPELKVPLIGFCGGPYTVAKYMGRIEHSLLEELTEASIAYLKMQIEAGVEAIQIFDSWAGLLEREEFKQWAYPYLKKMVEALRPTEIPVILFSRGTCKLVDLFVDLEPAAISFDWEESLMNIREKVPSHIAIQGNLNPHLLEEGGKALEEAVDAILEAMENRPGFIFNLGHGVLPQTNVEHAQLVVRRVQQKISLPY